MAVLVATGASVNPGLNHEVLGGVSFTATPPGVKRRRLSLVTCLPVQGGLPLHCAARHKHGAAMIWLLLVAGASVDGHDKVDGAKLGRLLHSLSLARVLLPAFRWCTHASLGVSHTVGAKCSVLRGAS